MKIFGLLFLTSTTFAAVDYDAAVVNFKGLLKEMVAADTSSPPGNEARIVKIVEPIFKKAGIPYEVTEFAPRRQNIVARLKGTGAEKPLLILAHIDVVGTTDQKWTTDPHTVTEKDGYLVGRGVSDDLGMAAAGVETLLQLKKSGQPLKRDVILALTGDEETDGLGIQYIIKNRFETIDAEIALNEGGGLTLTPDTSKMELVALQVAEKDYQDFELAASGTTGHSAVPMEDNSIYRLAKALDKFSKYQPKPRLLPVTRQYFKERAKLEPAPLAKAMLKIANSNGTIPADALAEVKKNPSLAANLWTTCVATLLNGGTKTNALPPTAKANLNCRILPDETWEDVQKRIASLIQDPKIEIKALDVVPTTGKKASDVNGAVPVAIRKIMSEMWPGVPVIPFLSRGATDSRFLRMKGINAYGIQPIAGTEADSRRNHGIDERILEKSIRPGLEFFHRLVLELAADTAKI